jgi:hypothetical protein
MEDAALVAGVRARNPAALGALHDRFAAPVLRILTRILGPERDLADLHHDAFVRALESIGDLLLHEGAVRVAGPTLSSERRLMAGERLEITLATPGAPAGSGPAAPIPKNAAPPASEPAAVPRPRPVTSSQSTAAAAADADPAWRRLAAGGGYDEACVLAGLFVLVPLTSMNHEAVEGSSASRVFVFGMDLRRRAAGGNWHLTLGAGPSLSVLTVAGRASGPLYRDASTTLVAAGGYVRCGVGYALSRTLSLRADGAVGAQARASVVDYAGREAARWGVPWYGGWITMEALFP